MKAYALKQKDGRYRCQNLFVSEEEYHRNVTNAVLYSDKEEADYWAESLNRHIDGEDFVSVVSLTITED